MCSGFLLQYYVLNESSNIYVEREKEDGENEDPILWLGFHDEIQ